MGGFSQLAGWASRQTSPVGRQTGCFQIRIDHYGRKPSPTPHQPQCDHQPNYCYFDLAFLLHCCQPHPVYRTHLLPACSGFGPGLPGNRAGILTPNPLQRRKRQRLCSDRRVDRRPDNPGGLVCDGPGNHAAAGNRKLYTSGFQVMRGLHAVSVGALTASLAQSSNVNKGGVHPR